jgi:hypothetical protein
MRTLAALESKEARHMCLDKKRYDSCKHARRESNRLSKQFNCEPQREYYCKYCWGWHLTSLKK